MGKRYVCVCGKEERGRWSLHFDLHALQLHDMVLVLGYGVYRGIEHRFVPISTYALEPSGHSVSTRATLQTVPQDLLMAESLHTLQFCSRKSCE